MTAPCETASLILLPFGLVCGSSSAEGVLPGAGQAFTPGRPCLSCGVGRASTVKIKKWSHGSRFFGDDFFYDPQTTCDICSRAPFRRNDAQKLPRFWRGTGKGFQQSDGASLLLFRR